MALYTETFDATPTGFTRVRSTTGTATVNASGGVGNISAASSSSNQFFRKEFDTGSPDMFAEMDILNIGSTGDQRLGLMIRCISTGAEDSTAVQNYYHMFVNPPVGVWTLLRWINGAATALVADTPTTLPAYPYKIRLEAQGTTIRAYIGGVKMYDAADSGGSSLSTYTRGGIMAFNGVATNTFDNLRIGALADDVAGPEPGRMLLAC